MLKEQIKQDVVAEIAHRDLVNRAKPCNDYSRFSILLRGNHDLKYETCDIVWDGYRFTKAIIEKYGLEVNL